MRRNNLYRAARHSACVALLALGASAAASAAEAPNVLQRAALMTPRAAQSVLLDVVSAGHSLVAVGERGIAMWSDDDGASWHQAVVPVSVTLTAVAFPTPQDGWAVGHGGVILHSADGGRTWALQLDGRRAAQLALDTTPKDNLDSRRQAEQLVADGPDKPFLAVHFDDARNGIAVGAYGLAFVTADGGTSWTPAMDRIDNPGGLHLYAIARAGDATFIAGEQGLLLRSDNRGEPFRQLPSPYEGSWFAVSADASGRVIAAGMLGHAFGSTDGGTRWQRIDTGTPTSFIGLRRFANDRWLLADAAGRVFSSNDGHSFSALGLAATSPLAGFTATAAGKLIGVGPRGVRALQLSTAQAGDSR